MFCQGQIQTCTAGDKYRHVLLGTDTDMFCRGQIQICSAGYRYRHVLPGTDTGMYCQGQIQTYVLPRTDIDICSAGNRHRQIFWQVGHYLERTNSALDKRGIEDNSKIFFIFPNKNIHYDPLPH